MAPGHKKISMDKNKYAINWSATIVTILSNKQYYPINNLQFNN